jgi:hypothetical protein
MAFPAGAGASAFTDSRNLVGNFRHHTYFTKAAAVQAFRFPFVCLVCRKSFKYPANISGRRCPQCKGAMFMLSRKFAAPRSNDLAQWEKVRFLIEHGFRFYPVYEPWHDAMRSVRYPATLAEAKIFVRDFVPNRMSMQAPAADAADEGA